MNRVQKIIFTLICLILSIPFIEQMDGNGAFNWSLFDFLVAFALLFLIGFSLEYLIRKIVSIQIKVLVISGIVVVFLFIWAELAVGIFNSPIAGD
jgi:hypothetical protein